MTEKGWVQIGKHRLPIRTIRTVLTMTGVDSWGTFQDYTGTMDSA